MNNIQISKNFKLKEFECSDSGSVVKVDSRLLEKLQLLRDKLNSPINITSSYRTPECNKRVGGSTDSYHMKGMAADINSRGYTPSQIAKAAEEVGFTGIGTYSNFVHVDVRPNKYHFKGGY